MRSDVKISVEYADATLDITYTRGEKVEINSSVEELRSQILVKAAKKILEMTEKLMEEGEGE